MAYKFLKVTNPTPILNTKDFQEVFGGKNKDTLKADAKGHIRALEFIALEYMIFEIVEKTDFPYIYKIKCDFYKNTELYIDSRFTTFIKDKKDISLKYLLDKEKILNKLLSYLGDQYLWGGNFSKGIKNLLKYYPAAKSLQQKEKDKWILKGADCSGILFEATNGYTPRNTSELLHFKEPVLIKTLKPDQIARDVKPLDIIVFKGHIIIVLDSNNTIESRENFGVIKTSLIERLREIHKTKKAANFYKNENDYVIRRWI